MQKENFINLLNRSTPNDIVDFIKAKGKGPKSISPIVFFEEIKPVVDTDINNFKDADVVE